MEILSTRLLEQQLLHGNLIYLELAQPYYFLGLTCLACQFLHKKKRCLKPQYINVAKIFLPFIQVCSFSNTTDLNPSSTTYYPTIKI
jgi:hypothetical protein